MARVTIEDCLKNVNDVHKLIMIAAKRAKQLEEGATPKIPRNNSSNTVLALREIAAGYTTLSDEEE